MDMFSFAKSLDIMVGLTTAGGEECGASGDYLSWEEEEWTLHSAARMLEVEASEGPCRRESEVHFYHMKEVHWHHECMEHCQKVGRRSVPSCGNTPGVEGS